MTHAQAQAPAMLTAAQLRVILRAIVNLDPYTFADDLAEDTADENDKRSAEEVLLAAIDNTADDKLTGFAVRLAISGHCAIPREGEPDFLSEAAAAFLTPKKPRKSAAKKAVPARKEPTTHQASKDRHKEGNSKERHSAARRERRSSLTSLGGGISPPTAPPHS